MKKEIISILSTLKLFSVCTEETLEAIKAQATFIDLPKGRLLFVNEDKADYFYVVASGWVKLFRETLDGSQAIIDILPEGHIFGETSIFQNDAYPYSAETAEPAKLIAIPLTILRSEIEKNPKFALKMMSAMARYRKQQDQELENRTLKNAPQRIGCFLLRLADQDKSGKVTIHLPYDKTLVASRLGMQPETFSRALTKLKDNIDLKVTGATIEVKDYQGLVNYVCSACSSEFPCKDLKD